MQERILFTACPLCGSSRFGHHRAGNASQHPSYKASLSPVLNWNRCEACGHVFTEGYYTEEALAVIFGETQDMQMVGKDAEPYRAVSGRMIDKMLPFQDGGWWLDVGFGNGSLMFTAQEYGFSVVGLDLRKASVDTMHGLGYSAFQKDIGDFTHSEAFSVISMADVLEHTPFPREALAAAHRLMREGGALLVSMPNSDSFIWDTTSARSMNPFWNEIEHYHNFGRKRLYALLSDCGFEPKRYGISERYRMCMEVIAVKR